MIGILLYLLSVVGVSASAGPQYWDSDAGSHSESADRDSTVDFYADSSSNLSRLRIALTTTEFRVCQKGNGHFKWGFANA
jgi:hypothetical protein